MKFIIFLTCFLLALSGSASAQTTNNGTDTTLRPRTNTAAAQTALSISRSFDTIAPKIRKCSQQIIEGHNRFCNASTLAGMAQHLLEQHAVHVLVRFEPQPIGGILTVQADLVHAYSGVGEAPRAIFSKTFTQAVEELTEEQVQDVAKMLISELGEEYSKGTIFKTDTKKGADGAIVVNTDYKMSPHTEGME